MFLIPPIASVVLFLLLWWGNLLSHPIRVGVYVVCGVALQFLAPTFSVTWVAGLLFNVGGAVYLTIRLKLDW